MKTQLSTSATNSIFLNLLYPNQKRQHDQLFINETQFSKRKAKETMVNMYISYLNSLVSGKFDHLGQYENDFIVKTAESVTNLHNNGYKVC